MRLTISTWNINSVRLRINLVAKFIKAERPDVICLQETKCPDDKFPLKRFARLGYNHVALNGQKGYHGVAVVSQELNLFPHLDVLANLFTKREVLRGPLFNRRAMAAQARPVLAELGLSVPLRAPVGSLTLAQRQLVEVAKALLTQPRVLILDEPTSALGVKQAGVVLRYIVQARDRGVAVIFITHNPHHAYPVGDRFVILNRGQSLGNYAKTELDRQELVRLMAGGRELAELEHELEVLTAAVEGA